MYYFILRLNYNPLANINDGSCCFISGCLNPEAINYNPYACYDDGSCIAIVPGCTIPSMWNYNPEANQNDGSCIPFIYGCTNETACNYNLSANTEYEPSNCTFTDGVCDICEDGVVINNDSDGDGVCNNDEIFGCTDVNACNFNDEEKMIFHVTMLKNFIIVMVFV